MKASRNTLRDNSLHFYGKICITHLPSENISICLHSSFEEAICIFVKIWNSYRLIEQKYLHLPIGILNSIFSFPESYGGAKDGFQVNLDLLREVAKV